MNTLSLNESKGSATAFAKERSNMWDLGSISSVLYPRFTLLEMLDESGDCAIFLARDERARSEGHDLLVKLKVLSEQARLDRKKLELFYLETRAAAKLSHKNIIKTWEAEQVSNIHFCAIEHKPDCESLRSLLDLKAWLDTELAAAITLQIAEALDFAYRQGVMHLKLQPEKILIDREGTAIITDFGIAWGNELRWAHRARAQGMPVFYCSPEQANGQDVDTHSDLYSLGIILYEMLTDRLPFDYQNPDVVLHKHRTQMPEPPDVFRSDLPAPVSAVVMSLLEKQPLKRPQTPAHLQAALNGIIRKQDTAEINLYEPVLDLAIDDETISGAAVREDKTEGDERPVDRHTEDAPILKPVAREQIARRERFEPPTITVIEPPLQEIVEHSPQIGTAEKVIVGQQESRATKVESAPAEIKGKLFLVLLIIIVAALSLILFDPALSFRNKAQTNSTSEASTKEGSTEAAQPAKPALNDVEDRAPLDSVAGSASPEKSGSDKTQTSRRVRRFKAGYSRQKPVIRVAPRKYAAKRARVRARYR